MPYCSNSRGVVVGDHPHTVRLEINQRSITQTSGGGVTRIGLSYELLNWVVKQAGSNNSRDWFWRAEYDSQHNHNYALFLFADPQVAMMFKLTWAGA